MRECGIEELGKPHQIVTLDGDHKALIKPSPHKPPNQIFTSDKFNSPLQHYTFHKPKSNSIHKLSVPNLLKNQCRFALLKVKAVTENAEESEAAKPREISFTVYVGISSPSDTQDQ
ncbi:hypothetical protein RND71_032629 [Anisodus tanguticus]|uniref:Uncharacterized protein n=1 Tax=Anisodus tanguticus TaxID=243964 RepID=A0AAE1R704_9SOLA|nr:hypothetical protein RND71_032629 [Anisodus tanguticus]